MQPDFERLINRHKDSVYRQMVRVCGNHADAEDALADAILAALKASDRLRDPSAMRGWLGAIATRVCARMRVRDRVAQLVSVDDLERIGVVLPESAPGPAAEAERAAMKKCVSSAVESVPEIYREVYVRREILAETAEAVASALQLTVPAVKSRLHRARKLMREALDSGFGCLDLIDRRLL